MNQVNCPYTTISEMEASKIAMNVNTFSFVPVANAQANVSEQVSVVGNNLSDELTTPFLFLIGSFFLFVILMSVVYMYHWYKFSLNDPFIKNFIPIFFFGILALSVPLIFNLFL